MRNEQRNVHPVNVVGMAEITAFDHVYMSIQGRQRTLMSKRGIIYIVQGVRYSQVHSLSGPTFTLIFVTFSKHFILLQQTASAEKIAQ